MSDFENAGPGWDASQVANFFEGLKATPAPSDQDSPAAVTPYHPAAAVLAAFDTATLKGLEDAPAPPPDEALRRLIADSVALPDAPGGASWSLKVGPRQAALATFATRDELRRALNLNDRPDDDPLQRLLNGFILGSAPDVDSLDEEGLTLASQVVGWLTGVPYREPLDLPDLDDIRRRLEFRRLINPLQRMVGDHFHGRADDLARIRRHVDGPPGQPLVIWGLGGVGKSTLIARAALDLSALGSPIVYLDFDRKTLSPDRPASLLLEAVRQVGAQMAPNDTTAISTAVVLTRELTRDLAEASKMGTSSPLSGAVGLERLSSFDSIVNAVPSWSGRPLLVAIDTFEDVQYRSSQTVRLLLSFLGQWQDKVPAVRVVIAGRAPIEGRRDPEMEIELKGLDPESAVHCLIDLGVPDGFARFVYEHVGGKPLSLHLAAEVVRRQSVQALAADIEGEEFAKQLDRAMVDGFLFRRVIDQIHNPRVRKLAHPGLVLRYITPTLIRRVLAGPCQIDVPDDATAQELWHNLALETSLVVVEAGAVLRHRPDLRNEMLHLLRKTKRGQAVAIHLAAVDFYARAYEESRDPEERVRNRAEELYHRLCLEQSPEELDPRWAPEAEPYLRGAVDELPRKGMAYLAAQGGSLASRGLESFEAVGVGDDFWQRAELEVWERKTAQWVRELIHQERFEEALIALRERRDRSPASPLWLLEARVLKNLGQWREAADVLWNALTILPPETDRAVRLDLLLLLVRVLERLGESAQARSALAEALTLAGTPLLAAQRIELAAAKARLAREGTDRQAARAELSAALASLSDRDLSAIPIEARRAAAELVSTNLAAVARVIRIVGLGPASPDVMAALGSLMPNIHWRTGLGGLQWSGIMPDDSSKALARDPGLAETLATYLRGDEEVAARRSASNAASYSQASTRDSYEAIVAAFLVAFDYKSLEEMLRSRFKKPLRELSPDASLSAAVLHVVQWAEREGQIAQLIKAAVEFRPDNAAIQQLRGYLSGSRLPNLPPGAIRLRPAHVERFVLALVDAFDDAGSFLAMIRYRTDRRLPRAEVDEADLGWLARATVQRANAEGWAGPLIAAAREARPSAPLLYEFAEDFGLTAARPEDDRMIRDALPNLDIRTWRTRVGETEGYICRIEVDGHQGGTGLLIGPDTVLTVLHLLAPVLSGKKTPADVSVTFDEKRLNNGEVWNAGLTCRLADDWLVLANPSGREDEPDSVGLDYAVLRVVGVPGSRPVGWPRSEPSAPPRGWFSTGAAEPSLDAGAPLASLSYSGPGPVRLVFDPRAFLEFTPPWVRYRGMTGSSGSPVFDMEMRPVALHQARVPLYDPAGESGPQEAPPGQGEIQRVGNEGVSLSAILSDIEKRLGADPTAR